LGEAKSIHLGDQRLLAGLQESDEKKSSRLVLEVCNKGREWHILSALRSDSREWPSRMGVGT
jgi:hypothetical protein